MKKFWSRFGKVELTDERLKHILTFHPEVRRYQKHFSSTLSQPELVRKSRSDSSVRIFYQQMTTGKWLAVVVKISRRNFVLTAYLTSKIQKQQS